MLERCPRRNDPEAKRSAPYQEALRRRKNRVQRRNRQGVTSHTAPSYTGSDSDDSQPSVPTVISVDELRDLVGQRPSPLQATSPVTPTPDQSQLNAVSSAPTSQLPDNDDMDVPQVHREDDLAAPELSFNVPDHEPSQMGKFLKCSYIETLIRRCLPCFYT
jgi:hypothetical protein